MQYKIIFCSVLLISLMELTGYSQGIDVNTIPDKLLVSFSLAPVSNSVIVNNSNYNKFDLANSLMIKPTINFEYMFSNSYGIKFGIGFNSYGKKISQNSYANKITGTDSDNDNYTLTVDGSSISEKDRLNFIEIPIEFIYLKQLFSSFGFYINGGFILSNLLNSNYDGSGTYSFVAYYPQYNLTLSNIPEHGLYQNKVISGFGNLQITSFILNADVEAGLQYKIKRDMSILFGINYSRSLNNIKVKNINDGLSPPTLPYSSVPDFASLFESNSKATLSSVGIVFSIRYLLK